MTKAVPISILSSTGLSNFACSTELFLLLSALPNKLPHCKLVIKPSKSGTLVCQLRHLPPSPSLSTVTSYAIRAVSSNDNSNSRRRPLPHRRVSLSPRLCPIIYIQASPRHCLALPSLLSSTLSQPSLSACPPVRQSALTDFTAIPSRSDASYSPSCRG